MRWELNLAVDSWVQFEIETVKVTVEPTLVGRRSALDATGELGGASVNGPARGGGRPRNVQRLVPGGPWDEERGARK